MKKLFAVLSLFLICFSPKAFSDVVYLNAGEEFIGTLKSIEKNKIKITDINKNIREIPTNEIAHILLGKTRKGDEINNTASITEPIAAGIMRNMPDTSSLKHANYATLYRLHECEYINEHEVKIRLREIVKILTNRGLGKANRSFSYLADRAAFNLEFAHTYSANGSVYHVTDDAISEENLRLSTPEYAKTKLLKFAMKKVDVGSIIDYAFTKTTKNIDDLHPYAFACTFGEREPILREELVITFPDGLDVKKVLMQWGKETTPKFVETKQNGKTTWRFVYSNPEGYIPEQNMLPESRIFPRVLVYIPSDMKKTAQSLSEAYIKAKPDDKLLDEIIARAEIKKEDNNFEKTAKIYAALNKDIRQIRINAAAMGEHLPISGNNVLTKKYGSPQAILAVMHFALKKLRIPSYPGFTSSKRNNITINDCSTLSLANEAVLKVVIGGKEYFTTGGSPLEPFSFLPTAFHGAKAIFLDIDKKSFEYQTLPMQGREWNRFSKSVSVKIKPNGDMNVVEILCYRGPFEVPVRGFKSSKQREKRNYAEARIKQVHPNAVLKSFAFSNLDDLSAPVTLTLNYTIPKAAQLASDKIMTFTNFWVTYDSSAASLETRKFNMAYWAQEDLQQTIVFELPEGFQWVKWNKQYHFISPDVSFKSSITQNESNLVYSDEFFAAAEEYDTGTPYKNFRSCMLTMSELANQWIILEKVEDKDENEGEKAAIKPALGTLPPPSPLFLPSLPRNE